MKRSRIVGGDDETILGWGAILMAEGNGVGRDCGFDTVMGSLRSAPVVVGSPALNAPVRDRKQAALDVALKALREIEAKAYEAETVKYVKKALGRIDEILTA